MSSDAQPATLGDLVSLRRGSTYKSALLDQPGPVLLGLASIAANGGFRRSALKTYGGESPAEITLRPGDLYVSLKDVTQSGDLLGAVARVPAEVELGRLTQDTVKLNLKDATQSDYLYWLLRTPHYRDYCLTLATGTTTLGLPRDDFLAYPVPPRTESRMRIVRALQTLDEKIEQNARLCSALELVGQQVFQDICGRFLSDGGAVVDLPSGWIGATIAESFDVNPKRILRAGTMSTHLEMRNMPTVGHFPSTWAKREAGSGARFINGDTLVSRITPCLENGKIAFVDFLEEGEVAWGSTEYLVLRARAPLPPVVGYFLARHPDFLEYAVRHMSGSSGRQRVSADDLGRYELVIAPREKLEPAGTAMTSVLAAIRALRLESRCLAAIRDSLLPKFVSGDARALGNVSTVLAQPEAEA
jgi:type I restriction enzyme S subunit